MSRKTKRIKDKTKRIRKRDKTKNKRKYKRKHYKRKQKSKHLKAGMNCCGRPQRKRSRKPEPEPELEPEPEPGHKNNILRDSLPLFGLDNEVLTLTGEHTIAAREEVRRKKRKIIEYYIIIPLKIEIEEWPNQSEYEENKGMIISLHRYLNFPSTRIIIIREIFQYLESKSLNYTELENKNIVYIYDLINDILTDSKLLKSILEKTKTVDLGENDNFLKKCDSKVMLDTFLREYKSFSSNKKYPP